ncbi:helix-turn-helix transcriptional regulator [Paraglaciecola sp.]|uniref:helix-turn-helix transcriptional regulator n=1 Tax=Paraglaciecola sp. TaxID=1920173 RepID=UPI003EF30BA0
MNRISQFRQKRTPKITQKELATKIGYQKARIANYERDIRTPNITDCHSIVAGLNDLGVDCSVEEVFPPKEAQHEI